MDVNYYTVSSIHNTLFMFFSPEEYEALQKYLNNMPDISFT